MKVKTALKSGLTISSADVQNAARNVSHKALEVGRHTLAFLSEKALPTLSNPKFWTWPF